MIRTYIDDTISPTMECTVFTGFCIIFVVVVVGASMMRGCHIISSHHRSVSSQGEGSSVRIEVSSREKTWERVWVSSLELVEC